MAWRRRTGCLSLRSGRPKGVQNGLNSDGVRWCHMAGYLVQRLQRLQLPLLEKMERKKVKVGWEKRIMRKGRGRGKDRDSFRGNHRDKDKDRKGKGVRKIGAIMMRGLEGANVHDEKTRCQGVYMSLTAALFSVSFSPPPPSVLIFLGVVLMTAFLFFSW